MDEMQKNRGNSDSPEQKKKRYQNQNYYIIKMISGGLIGYFGVVILKGAFDKNSTANPVALSIFGVLFLAFAAYTLIRYLREYLIYTKTNRFEDEVYGTDSEAAGLDPDAKAGTAEKPAQAAPAQTHSEGGHVGIGAAAHAVLHVQEAAEDAAEGTSQEASEETSAEPQKTENPDAKKG